LNGTASTKNIEWRRGRPRKMKYKRVGPGVFGGRTEQLARGKTRGGIVRRMQSQKRKRTLEETIW